MLAAVFVTILTAALPAAAASPAPRLKASGFLAVTTGSGSSQISSFNFDGSGRKQLTTGPANHYAPSLSPDGKRILFSGEEGGAYEIYVMNADGSGVTPVTRPPGSAGTAAWSPDGSVIAYAGLVAGKYQVFSAAPDGSNPVQLTHDAKASSASPAFSPDGATIAYSSTTIDSRGGGAVPVSRIWVMNAKDGSGAKALSSGTGDGYPAWIDNSALLFSRTSNLGKDSMVYSITTAGLEKAQSPAGRFMTEPKPLPDGKSYGATMLTGTALGLVVVTRADGGALALRPDGIVLVAETVDGFVLTPIAIQAGDVFTIVWILTPAPVEKPSPAAAGPVAATTAPTIPIVPLLLLALVVAVIVGVVVLILLRRTPHTREVRPGKFRSGERL